MAPVSSNLTELTVTCHQCGSASMERLDRKEYRCTHCGAITVISDDDADRVEDLLREALSRQSAPSSRTPIGRPTPPGQKATLLVLLMVGLAIVAPLIVSLFVDHHTKPGHSKVFETRTVAAEDIALSPLLWNKERKRYEGTVYNHSGYAIEVPRYTMTLFTDGHRSGSTWSDYPISRLLPGEYEPVSFDPRTFSTDAPPDRYEIDKLDRVDRSSDDIARPAFTQQQVVRQQGEDYFQIVGIVRNTLTRPIDGPRVMVVLYSATHEVLGYDTSYLEKLRPGEDGIVDMRIYPRPKDAKIASYEYLVDTAFDRSSR